MNDATAGPLTPPARILVADDEAALVRAAGEHLSRCRHDIVMVTSGREALGALRERAFDVAVLAVAMPSPDGLEILRATGDDRDRPEVIITAGNSTIDTAAEAMRLGAFAYLAKPYRMAELDVVLTRALERRALAQENDRLRSRLVRSDLLNPLETSYAPLRAVLELARRGAAGREPLLLAGPAGIGKFALAHELHGLSEHRRGPFLPLTGAQLSGEDGVSLLFGRAEEGGAPLSPAALSSAGTLYLGDLTAVPAALQRRLAQAVRSGAFHAEGDATARPVRARLIAASRGAPGELGSRVDPELAEVFSAVQITIPRLADRPGDVERLATRFVAAASGGAVTLDPGALALLVAYDWPANVTELRAVLVRALAVVVGPVIHAGDLAIGAPSSLPLAEVERRHIAAVLEATGWHRGRAAEMLGISPKTLYRKVREFGFQRRDGRIRA